MGTPHPIKPALGSLRPSENWQQRDIRGFFNSLLAAFQAKCGKTYQLSKGPPQLQKRLREYNDKQTNARKNHHEKARIVSRCSSVIVGFN